jgi:galactofuranosylgalactofuranosylrhamnosyl-N-acetylglucosaminyl-diphospho-decaprenol beta-1,5/1,6-galactofuranosyltransferase
MSISNPSADVTSAEPATASIADEADFPAVGPSVERLVAQRVLFAAPFHQVPDDLYSTVEGGNAARQRQAVALEPFSRVSTNTYFGRFPASYWQRWTTATEVRLEVVVSGSGQLSISASDRYGTPRVVAATEVPRRGSGTATEQQVTLTTKIDRFVDGGALWLELDTQEHGMTVREVRWSVTAPRRLRPTAVVVCTYNRPDDCLNTLEVLGGDDCAMQMVEAVYVIDQGTDTLESRDRFTHVQETLGPKLHYRRQPNLGGAGGFTRGLYEVADVQHADHANVLFMDDDILLEPDTVIRMTAFANRATEPVLVGAQMLYLLHPKLVYSWAQTTNLPALAAGVPVPSDVLCVDATRHRQDVRVDAGYNAWWSCLIPSEIVADAGYPLPLFFQWDDVEYGLRARAKGYPTVTLAGTGVWHADFNWKDEDNSTNYFNHRNALIVNALHGDFDPKACARVLRGRLMRHLVMMRYGLAVTMLKAVEDFLDGPETLRDGGVEAMAAVQKLRAAYPETQCHPASEVPGIPSAAMPLIPGAPAPSRVGAVLVKRLLWQLLHRTTGTVALSELDTRWWFVSRFRTVVVTDASQQGVHVLQLDRAELITIGKRAVRVLRRLRREGSQARQRYRAAMPELTSRQNWQRLFDGH